jgi:hypothetical protein
MQKSKRKKKEKEKEKPPLLNQTLSVHASHPGLKGMP